MKGAIIVLHTGWVERGKT